MDRSKNGRHYLGSLQTQLHVRETDMGGPFFVGVGAFNEVFVLLYASELHLDWTLEYKERTCTDQGKADGMIYGQSLPQVQDGESGKHGEGNNLLHRF